jgi:EAL domain-containing protein (putative c-di-GMP-specific phosphodiesterase class I)
MVEFARQIGADLVAEGIETQDELSAIMELGMTTGQGYLLGRPSVQPLDWAAWRTPAEQEASVSGSASPAT